MPKNTLTNPHDALFKAFLSDISVARDFLDIHLSAEIRGLCDLSTLQIATGSYIEEDLNQHFSDILYSLKIADNLGYIYILIEHQSTPAPLMPFRMLRYQLGVMKQHLNQGHKKLPLVVPLLFYQGPPTPYPDTTRLIDCFEEPKVAEKIWGKPFKLIDLTVIPDEELRTHKSVALLEIVQKHIRVKDIMHFIQDVVTLFELGYTDKGKSVLKYLFHQGECAERNQLIQFLYEKAPQYKEEIMTIAQQLRQEGRQEGKQEGRQEGEEKKAFAIAQNMLEEGIDLAVIQRVTGLDDKTFATFVAQRPTQH